ncbi:MAG: cob(I)yrinic acid a,c-diamide adenosyltransferase [Burkholderiaceae bacterium]|jgi:cob(I)alamin adenosyltransferase|nr:cob(I)yrinic acid a,c-diamide adenosyltransferase [Burkholderiaceae bacterium]
MFKQTIRIITKTGDAGTTSLADGSRISKTSRRIEAIGNVDELNSLIGLILSETPSPEAEGEWLAVQSDLFGIGAELSGSPRKFTEEAQVSRLESQAAKYDANLLPLAGFILPGGTRAGALFHYARSVCRRTERSVFALAETEAISDIIGKYLNRLSDLLFICARAANRDAGKADRLWNKGQSGAS